VKTDPRYLGIWEATWKLVESEIHDDRELQSGSSA
jgi:hypothetical protein